MAKIGKIGVAYIEAWIKATTATEEGTPLHITTPRELEAWAEEAEQAMADGNPPTVTMDEIMTKSGKDEFFTVPADGISWEDDETEDAHVPNIIIQFNAEQASAPIRWKMADPESDGGPDEWQSTPFQTADAGLREHEALAMVQAWIAQNA